MIGLLQPTTYYTVDSKLYIIRTGFKYQLLHTNYWIPGHYREVSGKSQTSRWSLRFSRNDWVGEVNKLFIICKFNKKNTGSNFQHPLASAQGHWRLCSLNQNKPVMRSIPQDTVSLTARQFFLFITSRSWPNLTTLKNFHNAGSLQENLANSWERILCAINITVHLILRVVSAL